MGDPEDFIREKCSANGHLLVPYYLMLSYLYYERDVSLVSDAFYDRICTVLWEYLPQVRHVHKSLVDEAALRSGTGFHLVRRFPLRVQLAACSLAAGFGMEPPPHC